MVKIAPLAAKLAAEMGWNKEYAARQLAALGHHLAATAGVQFEQALEQLAALAVRDLCCLAAENARDKVKALLMPVEVPAAAAPEAAAPAPAAAVQDVLATEPPESAEHTDLSET